MFICLKRGETISSLLKVPILGQLKRPIQLIEENVSSKLQIAIFMDSQINKVASPTIFCVVLSDLMGFWDASISSSDTTRRHIRYGPFPSCCLSRFRSESWCSTIVREMSLTCIRIRN